VILKVVEFILSSLNDENCCWHIWFGWETHV